MAKKTAKLADYIFEFIKEFIETHGFAPSVRNIQAEMEISSTSVVEYHLDKLEKDGRISRTDKTARSIVVNDKEGE